MSGTAAARPTTDVVLHCAGRVGETPVPVLRIVAASELNELPTHGLELYEHEGRALAEALYQHLPGGTVDQLLIALLEHRASLLRVRF